MSQNVIATEEVEFRPVLTLVNTDAAFESAPEVVRIAKIDSKTIVLDFARTQRLSAATVARTRDGLMGKMCDYGMIALASTSAVVAVYSLLNL